MNKQILNQNTFPLTVNRLAEMQEDYNAIANALAGLKEAGNSETKYIVSGCENRGDHGYVMWDGELMEVIADADSSKVNLDVYTETVSVAVGTSQQNVRSIRCLKYTNYSTMTSIPYMLLGRASLRIVRPDIPSEMISHSLWDSFLSAGIENGFLNLNVSCSTTVTMPIAINEAQNCFRLPAYFRPNSDVPVPCQYTPYGSGKRAGCIVLDSDGYLHLPFTVSRGDSFEIDTKIQL